MTYGIRARKLGDSDTSVFAAPASGDRLLMERNKAGGAIGTDEFVSFLETRTNLTTSSATAAAILNAVDDLETAILGSGTRTPSITFATPGDLAVSYGSIRASSWRRVDDNVFLAVNFNTVTMTHTTASGRLQVTNLPPTASAVNGEESIIPVRFYTSGIKLPRYANNLRAIVQVGDNYAELAFDTPYAVTRYEAYNLTTNFVAGEVITGGTSEATATIDWLEYADLGGTAAIDQNLFVRNVSGTFTPGETITGNGGGGGLIGGSATYATGGTQFVQAGHVTSGTAFALQLSGYPGIIL